MLGAALMGIGSPGAGGRLLGDSPAREYFACSRFLSLARYFSSFSLSPPTHLSKCLGSLNVLACYGDATIGVILPTIGLFWKRALSKRPYSAKDTCNFKEPSNQSHPITHQTFYPRLFRLLHWDSTDGDQHNDVCRHVRIGQTLWLRLLGLWRGDASNRMHTLTCTHIHTRARSHNPSNVALYLFNCPHTNPVPYFHYYLQVFSRVLGARVLYALRTLSVNKGFERDIQPNRYTRRERGRELATKS